jgi:thymidine kinase
MKKMKNQGRAARLLERKEERIVNEVRRKMKKARVNADMELREVESQSTRERKATVWAGQKRKEKRNWAPKPKSPKNHCRPKSKPNPIWASQISKEH